MPDSYYSSDDIEVSFNYSTVKSDYGVPGSPVWIEAENVQVEELSILGIPVEPQDLPADLLDRIHELFNEAIVQ